MIFTQCCVMNKAKKFSYDGPAMVSTGSQVKKWTVRQGRSRQDRGDPVEDTKTVNANANTGEVTVSGKSVKFSARSVKAESFAV